MRPNGCRVLPQSPQKNDFPDAVRHQFINGDAKVVKSKVNGEDHRHRSVVLNQITLKLHWVRCH